MTILNNQNRLKNTRKILRNNSTETEKILWWYLKWSKFLWLKFRRQHSIWRYILDFYCPKLKLSIEVDWEIHNERKEYDNIRTEYINAVWIKEIRFTNEEILKNIEETLKNIENAIIPLLTKDELGLV